jgi:hypothetical protein
MALRQWAAARGETGPFSAPAWLCGHPETARATWPPGSARNSVRRAARRQCLRYDWYWVALTARGPERAGWCPHPTGVGLARTWRLAYPPAPLQGPPPGLPRPRPGRAAGDALGACSGTDPDANAPCPPQARTGDPPRPSGRQQDPGPVAGFARRSRKSAARQRNRVGHRLPLPDTLTFARQIRGHSLPPGSKRSRSIRQRERSESATGMEGVEKMGWIFGERAGLRGIGARRNFLIIS